MAYWLDDGFDSWPEVIRAGTAATGLYVRCGSWIARNTHDGLVPDDVARMYGTKEWAQRLVEAGLWKTDGSGYRDVKYFAMGNPTADKVAARRKADADRKARWREKRDRSRRDTTRDSHVSPTVTDGVTPFSPALPPLKGEGAPARRTADAAPNLGPEDPNVVELDRRRLEALAAHNESERLAAEERARNGAAAARAAIRKRGSA